jgi:hypothetical protein
LGGGRVAIAAVAIFSDASVTNQGQKIKQDFLAMASKISYA